MVLYLIFSHSEDNILTHPVGTVPSLRTEQSVSRATKEKCHAARPSSITLTSLTVLCQEID
jgi:hypothetical protein